MTHEVRSDVFVGPLDVLVKLVVSQEVDIWEVSLSRLVDDFVAVMVAAEPTDAAATASSSHDTASSSHDTASSSQDTVSSGGRCSVDVETASEFALLAATLIELKSRRLLPAPPVEFDLDEELAAYGARDAALSKLIEGQTFVGAARLIRERWDTAAMQWPRRAGPQERFVAFAPDLVEGATPDDLAVALERVLAPQPVPHVDISHLRAAGITVEEALLETTQRLTDAQVLTFRELTSHLSERIVVVVYFLALLELFGSGLVELEQAERFGDIKVEWTGSDDAVLPVVADTRSEDAA